jgi:membrane protein
MLSVISKSLKFFREALEAWWNDNAQRLGAALAFYTLFAIAPVIIVAIAIAGQVFGPDAVRGHIVGQLDQLIGYQGAEAVQDMLQAATQKKGSSLATILGSFTFLLAATGAFLELQSDLNTIWRVTPKPGVNLKAFFLDRVRSFGLLISMGFLLLVSLAISALISAAAGWLSEFAPEVPFLVGAFDLIGSLVIATALFALLYRFLPDVQLRWRDVTIGAFVTAVLFTAGKTVIGLYLGQSNVASTYGAAGSIVVLLLWVYYVSQIVLLGAEFTRVYTERKGIRPPPQEFAKRDPQRPSRAT